MNSNYNSTKRRLGSSFVLRWLGVFALFSCFLFGNSAFAQVSAYTLAESTETYAQITGTTSTATSDDGTQTNVPIGFTFSFGGATYTAVGITTNGMIRLGSNSTNTAIASGWTNLLGNTAVLRPLIAPFWDDNNLSTGTIRYSTTGTAPNRVFSVNWHNTKVGGGGSTAGASVSSIVRLYENTNVIEFVYGNPYTTTNTVTASVGLNDTTSFLSVTPAATSTISSTTANNDVNASVMANLAGKKLTFTPPVIAIDMVATAIVAPVSACINSAAPISVTILNNGANTIDFSTNNAVITLNITGASTQTLTATVSSGTLANGASQTVLLSPNADFSAVGTHNMTATVVVTGDGENGNNATTASKSIVTSVASPYTMDFPTTSTPTGWNTTGWTIAASHGLTSNGLYRNLWSSATSGQFNTISVGPVGATDELKFDYRIVDFTSYPLTATAPGWGNFQVQISTDCGGTFSTVLTVDDSNHTTALNWAGRTINLSSYAGQTIMVRVVATRTAGDYFLDFDNFSIAPVAVLPPNCATALIPADLAANVVRNSTLTWTAATGSPTSYDVYFGTSTNPALVTNTVGLSYTPVVMAASTTYYWKVVPKNANGDATGCVEQSFTTGTNLQYCSVSTTNTSDYTSAFSTTNALSNINYSASSQPSGSYSDQTAQTFTLAQGQSFDFSHSYVGGSNGVKIWIDYNENGNFDAEEEVYYLANTSATKTGTVSVPLATPLGQYRMRVRSQFGSAAVPPACGSVTYGSTIDFTLNVVAVPSCFPPISLQATNITASTATISWAAPASVPANGYEWAVTTSATPPTSGTATSNVTAGTSGLSSGTLHYLHVRSVCVESEFSDWATVSFTTQPSCGNTFYDNGGVSGDYTNNLNTTTTIYPTNPGDGVIVTFTAFGTESCCDFLRIYDGPDATFPLIGTYSGTNSPGTITSTNSASGALTFVFTSDTSLVGLGWAANITCFTFPTDTPDYVNLQFPASASILAGESVIVYAQVYEAGLTDVEPGISGQAAGIEAWIGISPIGADASSNPNTWTTWIPATHNAGQVSNNDEYQANIGSTLAVGTYRYASRFRLNGGPFVYGGNPFNQWNGSDSNSGQLTVNPNPTQCAGIGAPANAATNVTRGTVALSWTAPTSGPAPTGYRVFLGTTSGSLTLMTTTNASTFTYNASAPAYSTTYYWRIVPTSVIGGGDAVGCPEWSFTTEADPFAPYCSGLTFTSAVEPITLVNFAGINNASSATLNGTPSHQNFISITGNVTTESTYVMTLKGNTDGDFANNFRVFIDWNQDGDFADAGETFNAGSITNSTGLDAIQAVTNIIVPGSALAGPTRMRVKKIFGTTNIDNPCLGTGFGQVEDYTLNVTLCTPTTWYADADGDGFGNNASTLQVCNQPVGYVAVGGDCNDNNASINPGATEICYDGLDNDCDGIIDNGCTPIVSVVLPNQC
ncbi:GEVED domain-containing protein, partial [Flavobacterium lacus]